MDRRELEQRTKQFAVDVIRSTAVLPQSRANDVIARQLLRSACSIGANYREACRGESRSDFVHKIGIAAKEAAETEYWLELLIESNDQPRELKALLKESGELLRIMISSGRTARSRDPRRNQE